MIFKPWDCAQPDEWLPQSLRLCWGSGDSSDGGGGASTGGGDWGSAGSYDASGFDAGGNIGAWGGTAYDASTSGTGAGGGGDWGSFGATNYSGFNAPNAVFTDVAGPNAGVTTGGGDWGSAGTTSFAGTGGASGGSMWGDSGGGTSYSGGGGGGGFWGSTTGGGDYGGGGGGGGGGYTGGGGGGGGGSFGSFGSGTLGGSNAYAAAPTGPTGSTFADSYGGGSVAGPATGQVTSDAPTTSEAQTESAGPSESETAATETDAAPDAPDAAPGAPSGAAAGTVQGRDAPDEAAPAQQDSFASRFDAVAPAQQDSFASRFDAATPDAAPAAGSPFGPQSVPGQEQQDSFDSRFGFDTAPPAPGIETSIPGGRETDFDYGPGPQTAGPDFNQVFADLGIQPGWNPAEQTAGRAGLAEPTDWAANPYQPSTDVSVGRDFNQAFDPFGDTAPPAPGVEASIPGGRETDFNYGPGQQTAAPNFDQVFADLGIQPGWNPAEQAAGRTGLAEPTDWAANPYEASTDVSVGRDFNQAFDPFGDTPTGMDLAGDQRSEAEPALTFNEMWGTTPYSTLPNDPLSRSPQQTLESDFNYFPNPGYVQGPPAPTWGDRLNDTMSAIIDPVANVTMYPFAKGLDALMALPNPLPPGTIDPFTAFSNFAQNALLGGSNIQSPNADAFNAYEAGQQGRAGANPDTTDYASVFEGAAPTEAQPSIEAFIPGGRETTFDPTPAQILAAQQPAPVDVELVPSTDPSVPADPRANPQADPAAPPAMPPAVPTDESRPAETPESGRPAETPETGRPAEQQPQAPPSQQTPQTPPQEARPAPPPGLIEQVPTPPTQTPPAQPPGLVTMLPPPTLTTPAQPPAAPPPETRPAETPAEPGQPDEHDNAPEPPDTSQPPQDPNAPRPPANIPGVPIGSRGTYENERADNPRTNRNYLDSGRLDNPQGEPGITYRTARQAGVEPLFRIGDIDVGNVSARLVENINRALTAMEQRTGIPASSLVATSGQRFAFRGGAIIHGHDPRMSQESVRSRGNASGGGGFAAAPPGRSNHGGGRAIDFANSRARDWLRRNAREFDLETLGGTFDMPHIQLRGGAGANMGARPSEQEQAEQRAINEQNRQAAIDRGLLGPGRGNQQAGVPTPRARPSGAPQPEVAQPDVARPPAEVSTNLPPVASPDPVAPRPPADIPAPASRGPNEFDIPVTPPVRNATVIANNILKQATAHLNTNSDTAALNAAGVVAAKAMAAAGIPANLARSLMLKGALEGAIANGYGPGGPRSTVMGFSIWGKVQSTITESIDAAMQGYQPAKPGAVQGPPSPAAPGRQGSLGGLLHLAAGGRDVGAPPEIEDALPGPGLPGRAEWDAPLPGEIGANINMSLGQLNPGSYPPQGPGDFAGQSNMSREPSTLAPYWSPAPAGPAFKGPGSPYLFDFEYDLNNPERFLAKGGHVDKDEPVVVGEEGPETFVPDQPGTVVPHMPQPGGGGDFGRWPKLPTPDYPGRYAGVGREMKRQTREAQNPMPSLMDMIDSGRLPLNAANWHAMMNDPALIALGRSRMVDNRKGIDPGAEQYGAFVPAPVPALDPSDPTNPMAQALGYGSIRRAMRIGRQSYQQ